MNARPRPRPVRINPFPNGELGIAWDDGHESYFAGHALRCACVCASCVDEVSGEKLLQDERVPAEVAAREIVPVGNYGISIHWSDGHDTGIYDFGRLREICPCDDCSAG